MRAEQEWTHESFVSPEVGVNRGAALSLWLMEHPRHLNHDNYNRDLLLSDRHRLSPNGSMMCFVEVGLESVLPNILICKREHQSLRAQSKYQAWVRRTSEVAWALEFNGQIGESGRDLTSTLENKGLRNIVEIGFASWKSSVLFLDSLSPPKFASLRPNSVGNSY